MAKSESSTAGLWSRSTPDLVMLGLTVLICVLLIGGLAGVAILVIWGDGTIDIGKLIQHLSSTTSSLIAAVVGYAAGRGMSGPDAGGGTPNEGHADELPME